MEYKKLKGTRDYYGAESNKLRMTIEILEEVAKNYNYKKMVTPTFESSSLFSRAVGSSADVVNKEMYSFEDKKGRSLSLKPEGTSPVVRSVLENKLLDNNNKPDLYYISSMFRYERPQKGRQREFFQFGIESFGKDCTYVDFEVVAMAKDILDRLNITKYELQINSIGDSKARQDYNNALEKFVSTKMDQLSDYAKEKVNSGNVMRVFDSKEESDLELLKDAPKISEFISPESRIKFASIKDKLKKNNIEFIVDETLVRGLDYYNDLVFEFVSTDIENLGSKSTIIGGGRYDSLINKMDESKDVPAIGFAIGIERLMLAAKEFLDENYVDNLEYYIACAYPEEELQDIAQSLAIKLRKENNNVFVDYSDKKLPKKFDLAEKMNALKIIVVGNETKNGIVTIKDIVNNTQEEKQIKDI